MLSSAGCKSKERAVASTIVTKRRSTVGCKMNQAVFGWLSSLLRCPCEIPFEHETKSSLMMIGVMIVGLWVLVEWALSARRSDARLGGLQGERFPG